jgi:hypothetical protein
MSKKIKTPATCEAQLVVRFVNAKNICPAEIHRQNVEVCGEGAVK